MPPLTRAKEDEMEDDAMRRDLEHLRHHLDYYKDTPKK
jgi:hypothetical protein